MADTRKRVFHRTRSHVSDNLQGEVQTKNNPMKVWMANRYLLVIVRKSW